MGYRMNHENVKTLLDHLEGLTDGRLSMNEWLSRCDEPAGQLTEDCGTAGCLAGWACALFAPATQWWEAEPVARKALGLNTWVAGELFRSNCQACTQGQAIARLRFVYENDPDTQELRQFIQRNELPNHERSERTDS